MVKISLGLVLAAAVSLAAGCASDAGDSRVKAGVAPKGQSNVNFDLPGYVTEVHDGRLWVFIRDSKAYKDFKTKGEPAKLVTRIGAGPNGMTMRSTDAEVIDGYLLSKPGYVTEVHDGRLWVFLADSKDYSDFKTKGEPAKIVTRIGAGPNGMTMRSTEAAVIDGYLAAKP